MADKNKRTKSNAKTTKRPVTNEWFKNALSSMGSIGKDVISSMAPSIANFTQETGKITKEVQTNIKQGNYSQKRVVESIKNNPYMKTVTTAFENAVRQLKTGNLNTNYKLIVCS